MSTSWILESDRGKGLYPRGQLFVLAGAETTRLARKAAKDVRTRKRLIASREWISSSPKARQANPSALPALRGLMSGQRRSRPECARSTILSNEAARPERSRLRGPQQRLWRSRVDRQSQLQAAAGGIVGVIGPTALGKDHACSDDHPSRKTRTRAPYAVESVHSAMSRPVAPDDLDGKKTCGKRFRRAKEWILLASGNKSRGDCSSFNFKGADQQKKVGHCQAVMRNRGIWPKMLNECEIRAQTWLLLDEPTTIFDVDVDYACARCGRGAGDFAAAPYHSQ